MITHFGLPVGAWLDRWARRPILIGSDVARAVLLATIPLAAVLGALSVLHLVIVSLLVGLSRVFFDIGYRSYLPSVVGTDRVLSGNSSIEFVRASGQVVGPGVGGALVTLVGAASVVFIQAVTFAISAISLLAIRTREASLRYPRSGRGCAVRSRRASRTCSGTTSFARLLSPARPATFPSRSRRQ
jgi:MFS family permease